MTSPTLIIREAANRFFADFDNRLEEALDAEDVRPLEDFLETCIQEFPTFGEYIYDILYKRDPQLQGIYTDYTLMTPKDPNRLNAEVESCRQNQAGSGYAFHIDYYNNEIIKTALKAKKMAKAHCPDPELSRFRDNWRKDLTYKGYEFIQAGNTASPRNVAFHLAFALDLSPEELHEVLTKCLLQDTFNPKNHRECIYRYCLTHKISYQTMVRDYLQHYHSPDFAESHKNTYVRDLSSKYTVLLTEQMDQIMALGKEELFDYLWQIKVTETAIENRQASTPRDLTRKTSGAIFWDNYSRFPKAIFGDSPVQDLTFEEIYDTLLKQDLQQKQKKGTLHSQVEIPDVGLPTINGEKIAALAPYASQDLRIPWDNIKPVITKFKKDIAPIIEARYTGDGRKKKPGHAPSPFLSDTEAEQLLPQILKKSRANYHAKYQGALLSVPTLKQLFNGIEDYTFSQIVTRRLGNTPISRNNLVATLFIAFVNDRQPKPGETKQSIAAQFEAEANENLDECGLHKFYLRNPFDLFIYLCFLFDDPLAYFMASWETAIRAGA